MEWNVFYHDSNKQELKTFNIFNHSTFNENVQKLLKKYKDKNEFAENLKRELMYYFWCKSEYEVIISPWCGGRNTKDIKVDIYTQVMNNWDIFLDYVWSSKKRLNNHLDEPVYLVTCRVGEDKSERDSERVVLGVYLTEKRAVKRKKLEEKRVKEAGFDDCNKFYVEPWLVFDD